MVHVSIIIRRASRWCVRFGGTGGEVGWFNWAYFGRGLYSFISVFGGTRCRMEERAVGECWCQGREGAGRDERGLLGLDMVA